MTSDAAFADTTPSQAYGQTDVAKLSYGPGPYIPAVIGTFAIGMVVGGVIGVWLGWRAA